MATIAGNEPHTAVAEHVHTHLTVKLDHDILKVNEHVHTHKSEWHR
jgi:hypothetical protein